MNYNKKQYCSPPPPPLPAKLNLRVISPWNREKLILPNWANCLSNHLSSAKGWKLFVLCIGCLARCLLARSPIQRNGGYAKKFKRREQLSWLPCLAARRHPVFVVVSQPRRFPFRLKTEALQKAESMPGQGWRDKISSVEGRGGCSPCTLSFSVNEAVGWRDVFTSWQSE